MKKGKRWLLRRNMPMAAKGRVYLFGPGTNRVKPIHGADLAAVCAHALEGERQEIDGGGPETGTHTLGRHFAYLARQA